MKAFNVLGMSTALSVGLAQFPLLKVHADDRAPPALSGQVTSEAEGAMEGVVVTAHQDGSIVSVSVTTNARGRYAFPESKLAPGAYKITIRAVGYDLRMPATADIVAEKTATVDIKLKKTGNLASQLSNAEWMMSIPGSNAMAFRRP
jgi:virginiamycin B lyase